MTRTETTAPVATTVHFLDQATAGGLDIQDGVEVYCGKRVRIGGADYIVVSVHHRSPQVIWATVRRA